MFYKDKSYPPDNKIEFCICMFEERPLATGVFKLQQREEEEKECVLLNRR